MTQNTISYTIEDYDGETSKASVNIGPLTALNFDAKLAAGDDYKAALGGIILGEIRKTIVTDDFAESTAPVTSQSAQRETKWKVTYRDNTQFLDVANTIDNTGFGGLFSKEIPTAKLSLLTANNDTLVLTTSGAIADYVAAFEAIENSPTGGNDISVVEIKHVGRNL